MQKEPPLNAKMRRDGTMTVVNVKVERTSTDGLADKSKSVATATAITTSDTTDDIELTRPIRVKKEKPDEPKSNAVKKGNTVSESINSKKNTTDDLNDSLEIVATDANPTIDLLSDDENDTNKNDDNKMPPPSFVPPVKAVKEKKAPVEKKIRSTRSKQPKRAAKVR